VGGVAVTNWASISDTASCENSPGAKKLGERQNVGIKECKEVCEKQAGCNAVDYYRKTKWCIMNDVACASPDKVHDDASSYKITSKGVDMSKTRAIHNGEMTFLAARRWCQESAECKGFSYDGVWSDKDQESGVPKQVFFAGFGSVGQDGNAKWNSFIRRDNPRANCNPEGKQFECPQNPYACLGLSMDADDSAIKQGYRALSRRMHPDKLKASMRTPEAVKQAEAAFREISEAQETLTDGRKRRESDQRLRQERQNWENQRASVQDIYIKEPMVSTLEPESYPLLIPKAQEWLVHFFLPSNGDCKQMKMALGRVVQELGTGESERAPGAAQPKPAFHAVFREGDVLRGRLRPKSLNLRDVNAKAQDGDAHIALEVGPGKTVKLFFQEEPHEVEVKLQDGHAGKGGRPGASLTSAALNWEGTFDPNSEWFRGTIVAEGKDVGSFMLQRDYWREVAASAPTPLPGVRTKPRLYGAVNCGRFPEFCKRKGVDPAVAKHFPQVRVLYPEEMRFEVYHGRPLGKDLVAFTREATRTAGYVRKLDLGVFAELQAAAPAPWLVLLQRTPALKKGEDCPLCKAALPMLRRSAPRMASGGMQVGWVNCTAEAHLCELLSDSPESGANWGSLQLMQLGTDSAQATT
ncbi:unnamed protein product, partial [Polarella glacialis]